MQTILHTLSKKELSDQSAHSLQQSLQALENGLVIYCPDNAPDFLPSNRHWLEAGILDGKHKNLSYDVTFRQGCVTGFI